MMTCTPKLLAFLRRQQALTKAQRGELVDIATEEYPWLARSATHNPREKLQRLFQKLKFVAFDMNGADDVNKCVPSSSGISTRIFQAAPTMSYAAPRIGHAAHFC